MGHEINRRARARGVWRGVAVVAVLAVGTGAALAQQLIIRVPVAGGGAGAPLPNSPPTAPTLSASTFAEANELDAVVATISSTDPEGDAITYDVTGDDAGFFSVSGTELRAAVVFNFDGSGPTCGVDNLCNITITASDDGNPVQSASADVTITITDVADDAAIAAPDGSAWCVANPDSCPEMVFIPAGSFLMGSPLTEPGRDEDEDDDPGAGGSQVPVTIGTSFAVGKFEVTFAQWDACVADGGCGGHTPGDQGWGGGDRPVIDVSWHHAQSYVSWLSDKTGHTYRLLSEAEWEYVARAGTTTPFWWGNTINESQANYDCTFVYEGGGETCTAGLTWTEPVGSYAANPFGLHDVHGNVWEWVEDCWNNSYNNAPTDGSANTTGSCSNRVSRGGSWNSEPRYLRSANRNRNSTDNRYSNLGFRVARTL